LSDIRGGAQQNKVEGGCQQICERMADDIGRDNIILRCPVETIEQGSDGVVLHCSRNRTYKASYVLVTAPPQVCAAIRFSPPLPEERNQLHLRFRMGSVIKIYVLYDTWWWREKGLSGEFLSDEEPVLNFFLPRVDAAFF
jgi:monoamine oxidase